MLFKPLSSAFLSFDDILLLIQLLIDLLHQVEHHCLNEYLAILECWLCIEIEYIPALHPVMIESS